MALGLSLELILFVVDLSRGHSSVLASSYLVPVLIVAVVENGERTAVIAVVAMALAIVSGILGGYFGAGAHIYRLGIVAGAGALGVIGATFRTRAIVARDQIEMLARIAELADAGSELEDALHRLAGVLVPGAADLCELVIIDADSAPRLGAREGDTGPRSEPRLPDTLIATARSGGAVLVRHLGRSPDLHAAQLGATELANMRAAEMASAIYAPVRVAEETLALLIMAVGPSGRRYGPADLRFARTVGSRAALAIQNARLLNDVRAARQRMEAIVGSLADAVTIRDLSGHVIYANDTARRQLGISPQDAVAERDPANLFQGFTLTDENGAPLSVDDLPSLKVLAGGEPEPLTVRMVNETTGEEAWRVLKATPLYDAHGRVEAAVTVIEDVTATKRGEMRSGFLTRASDILAGSLDYEQTLSNVAWLAVPELADWCAVDLVDEHGRRQAVATAHRDPAKAELALRLRELEAEDVSGDSGLDRLLATGEPLLLSTIPDELLVANARSEEHLDLIRQLRARSALAVPLQGADRIIGAMTLLNAESGRRFNEDDVAFARQIAGRAAVAVENARIYSERSRIADTLQHSLLPSALPEIPGWELASLYRPAGGGAGGGVEVGGDFYDAFAAGSGWLVLIGDVTGKGVEAAAMTSLVRHGARFIGEFLPEPAVVLARLDRALRQQDSLSLCTALCVRLEGDRITVASAGHPPPLLITEDGARAIGSPGAVLGAFDDGEWPTTELVLGANEVLLLYTDGVTDTVGGDDRFGESRLLETVAECGPLGPAQLLNCLDTALTRFQSGGQADDTAAVAMRLTDAEPPPVVAAGERGAAS